MLVINAWTGIIFGLLIGLMVGIICGLAISDKWWRKHAHKYVHLLPKKETYTYEKDFTKETNKL